MSIINGSSASESLSGTAESEEIFAFSGDDVLSGLAGNDTLWGGSGNDTLSGDEGDDTLSGGEGTDRLDGGAGNDLLYLIAEDGGPDTLDGGEGLDRLFIQYHQLPAGEGVSIDATSRIAPDGSTWINIEEFSFYGSAGNDTFRGAGGADVLIGFSGADLLEGRAGADDLLGEAGDDTLRGGEGDDRLYGDEGADRLEGEAGNDEISIVGGEGPDTVDGGEGDDWLRVDFDVTAIQTGQDLDFASGQSADGSSWVNIERFSFLGNSGNDTVRGSAGADELLGYAGADFLDGRAGADYLSGGAGNDTLIGGDGDDTLGGGDGSGIGSDSIDAGEGNDTVSTLIDGNPDTLDGGPGDDLLTISFDFGAPAVAQAIDFAAGIAADGSRWTNIERFQFFGGSSDDTVRGGTGADGFYGNAGADLLDGGDGKDTLSGAAGDDTLLGGEGDDLLQDDSGADSIDGGGGNDLIYLSTLGPDTLDGGAGDDVLTLRPSDAEQQVGQEIDFSSGRMANGSSWTNIERFQFFGGSGNDRILGGNANDSLRGAIGDDTLSGGAGDDVLDGSAGADLLEGGEGSDRFLIGRASGTDTLDGGPGLDFASFIWNTADFRRETQADGSTLITDINLSDGDDGVFTLRSVERLVFRDGTVQLGSDNSGNEDYDLSGPGGGTAAGGEGDDVYVVDDPQDVPVESPGEGIDTVRASLSWTLGANLENLVLTGTSNLTGTGNVLANRITGNAGNNTLDGATGVDTMEGAEGNDTYFVDDPRDVVIEITGTSGTGGQPTGLGQRSSGDAEDPASIGDVADALRSSASTYTLPIGVESGTLLSGAGNGVLNGNADANPITGNAQANLLAGGGGNDTLAGGTGNDVVVFSGARSGYTVEMLSGGVVRVTDTDLANGNDGIDELREVEALRFADSIEGGLGKPITRGGAAANTLDLTGSGGQIGAGGAGNDIYRVNSAADATVELANGGRDRVDATVNWVLWDNVEDLRLTGSGATSGWGNALGNRMEGNGGANRLQGYGGNDTLVGGAGADTLVGGTGNDTYIVGAGDVLEERSAEGTDTVQSAVSWTLGAEFESLRLAGSNAVSGTGNDAANALTGNGAANRLSGGGGDDTLTGAGGPDTLAGGAGNDTYVVGAGDKLEEGVGAGVDLVQSPIAWTLAANLENLELTGTAPVGGTGNGLDNRLTGNSAGNPLKGGAGADRLDGKGGGDTLSGGAGADTLTGGAGSDAFVFDVLPASAADSDVVVDFSGDQDAIQFEGSVFTGLADGELPAAQFLAGAGLTQAGTASQRIVYDTSTGILYYDADGAGGISAVQVAVLSGKPLLAADDIFVG